MATGTGWQPLRPPARPARVTTPPFQRLAVTHVLSLAGDGLVTVALAGSLFFDISPSAARGRVALSLLLTILPFGVVAPFLGPAIDRIAGGRRLMVVGAATGRVAAALYAATVLDGLLLFPTAFALLVLSKTHAVAKSSLVPTVVDSPHLLVGANARLALAGALVGSAAAAPGVLVMQLFGAEWVMRLAAVAFAAAAVAGARIVVVHPDDPAARTRAQEELSHAGVRLAATAMGVLRGSVGFLTFLVAFALRRSGEPAWLFGVVIGASVAGSLLGSVVAPALRRRVVEEHLLAASLGLVVVVMLMAARTGGRMAPVMAAAVVGLAAGSGKLAFDSLVQRDAPAAAQGRSFARFEAAFQLAWVVGALIPVVLAVPSRLGYVLLAVAAAVGAGLYLAGLATHRHREEAALRPAGADG
ncbi:MAG: MFS transporter [Acidimicrobiia bacterium]